MDLMEAFTYYQLYQSTQEETTMGRGQSAKMRRVRGAAQRNRAREKSLRDQCERASTNVGYLGTMVKAILKTHGQPFVISEDALAEVAKDSMAYGLRVVPKPEEKTLLVILVKMDEKDNTGQHEAHTSEPPAIDGRG